MQQAHLGNYLVSNRKRLGLSQADVAFLLGGEGTEKVSRHERFHHEPSLRTALAYEAIYKRSVAEILSALYGKIEREVAGRAKVLARKTMGAKPNRRNSHKVRVLEDIAGELPLIPKNL